MKINFPKLKFAIKFKYSKRVVRISRVIFWFSTGGLLSLFFVTSFGLFSYQKLYENKVYQGVYVDGVNLGGETKQEIKKLFSDKNSRIKDSTITFVNNSDIATASAGQLNLGYDGNLSADQAYSIGRSGKFISDLSLILQAYVSNISLRSTYTYNQKEVTNLLQPISKKIDIQPVNAVFKFENNRVTTFIPSENGRTIDTNALNQKILTLIPNIANNVQTAPNPTTTIVIPVKILAPEITTEKVNNMGIKELIGMGNSYFYHSIPGRIHNVALATSRVSGALVAPGETFSFDKTLGDVTAFTGYQQAYVIQNGKTVLGDGGGVCQVSTTFFRALLDAGLPIVERHAHAYRVGYYEENGYPPGIDATVFVPYVDLKFLNDTGHYILVQSKIDLDNLYLEFDLYGTKDGRTVTLTSPSVTNQVPPPPDVYQDDPTLPKGEIKQTDFAAWGADVSFTRTVTKNGKVIISDKFVSNYQPWQAIYLRGTQ
jgi:vancomycin resistance protein YoaR